MKVPFLPMQQTERKRCYEKQLGAHRALPWPQAGVCERFLVNRSYAVQVLEVAGGISSLIFTLPNYLHVSYWFSYVLVQWARGVISASVYSFEVLAGYPCFIESQTHRMDWAGRDLKAHLVPTQLIWAGLLPTRLGCPAVIVVLQNGVRRVFYTSSASNKPNVVLRRYLVFQRFHQI